MGDIHYFASTADRTNATDGNKYGGTLGTEIDLVFAHAFTPEISLNIGYSQMVGISKTMKQVKFGNPNQEIPGLQNWGWVMISFSPKFF
jgi:hypothetical protein